MEIRTAGIKATTAENRFMLSNKKGGPGAALSDYSYSVFCTLRSLHTVLSVTGACPGPVGALNLFPPAFLPPGSLRVPARQLPHQKLHHRASIFPAALQPVIRFLQSPQAFQQSPFRYLS
jgi:hypothetical protein